MRFSLHNYGFFRLDGGAMFGSIPKNLWAKAAPPDEQNRILLATRSLVIQEGQSKIVVDLGCGDKWNDKLRAMYKVGEFHPVENVTDVLLTHLHFDHAGGVSVLGLNGLQPRYPDARHYVSGANLANAKNPNPRERASYLPENVDVLDEVDTHLTEDGEEIWPGVWVHQAHGHTHGLQWIRIEAGNDTIAFPADLMPTAAHLGVPYVMGYDMCAQTAMAEKEAFLNRAIAGRWIVVFEHDPELGAARLEWDDRGRPRIAEPVLFD